jgi:hypothetical protein
VAGGGPGIGRDPRVEPLVDGTCTVVGRAVAVEPAEERPVGDGPHEGRVVVGEGAAGERLAR